MSLFVFGDLVDVPAADARSCWAETRGGIIVPSRPRRKLRAVDLFAGCGGFSLGVQQSGIDVVAALEWWAPAVLTYLTNLGSRAGCAIGFVSEDDRARLHKQLKRAGETATSGLIGRHNPNTDGSGCRAMIVGDAARATAATVIETLATAGVRCPIDVVIGGPPCQGISQGNAKRSPADPRNNLVLEFIRLADELGAEMFVMENVPPLFTDKSYRPLFDRLVSRANAAGFDVTANVLDAANYGVPQFRRRLIVVGSRGAAARAPFAFPLPTHWPFVKRSNGPTQEQRLAGARVAERATGAVAVRAQLSLFDDSAEDLDDESEEADWLRNGGRP